MSANDIIKQAFGKNCDLYSDVLECPRDATPAALRRAYYRTALKYHPDKVLRPHNDSTTTSNETLQKANEKFHAITAAYQILCHAELRKEYDTTGVIPDTTDDDDDEFNGNNDNNPWKEYFDRIFGKVTNNDIDLFASKYKCSEEEQRDVLHQYQQQKGNLSKMLNHVMLSEHIDVVRWVQDYINPAIQNGSLTSDYNETMQRTLKQIQTKIEKERKQKSSHKISKAAAAKDEEDADDDNDDENDNMEEEEEEEGDFEDDDETETDDEEDVPPPSKSQKTKKASAPTTKSPVQKKTQPPMKTKRTKPMSATTKNKKNNATDLISLIQNKNRNSASNWSDFGARYGVTMPDEDPIPDHTTFQQIQSKLKNQKGKKKK